MDWIKRRAVEPSTWKGAGWLLVALGVLPVGGESAVVALGAAVVGFVEMVRKEK